MDSASLKLTSNQIFQKITELSGQEPEGLRHDIFRMRETLTSHRDRLLSGYMNRAASFFAYLNYHVPVHLPETLWILDQNRERLGEAYARTKGREDFSKIKSKTKLAALQASAEKLKNSKPTRVLDIGCGPGTSSLSLILWLKALHLPLPQEFELLDLSQKALNVAEELVTLAHGEKPRVRKFRGHLLEGIKKIRGPFDWLLLSHVLNEMGSGPRLREKKTEMLSLMRKHLTGENTHILIVEPPLREPTMDLMWIRDQIMQGELPGFEIIGPCPQGVEFCPLAFEKKGWCYAQPPRQPMRAMGIAPWDRRLERTLNIELDQPGFSYLLLKAVPISDEIVEDDYDPNSDEPRSAKEYGVSKPSDDADHFIAISDESTRPAWVCSRSRNVRYSGKPNPFRGAYLKGVVDHSSRQGVKKSREAEENAQEKKPSSESKKKVFETPKSPEASDTDSAKTRVNKFLKRKRW